MDILIRILVFLSIALSIELYAGESGHGSCVSSPVKITGNNNLALASPARWKLVPHLAIKATDPTFFLGMVDTFDEVPLPRPCLKEKIKEQGVAEIETLSITKSVSKHSILNIIADHGWSTESRAHRNENGCLIGYSVSNSNGDDYSCQRSYDEADRLASVVCNYSSSSYYYDNQGRVELVVESGSELSDSFLGFKYTGAQLFPETIKHCEDIDLQYCDTVFSAEIDDLGLVTSLRRTDSDGGGAIETFKYNNRGLLTSVNFSDIKGDRTSEQTFTYNESGDRVLLSMYSAPSTEYTTRYQYHCPDFSDYKVENFFRDIQARHITTEDAISPAQKAAITESGFDRKQQVCDELKGTPELFYDTWYVAEKRDGFLKLGRCGTGSNVQIHLYQHKHGGSVASIVSLRGNHGQNQEFRFFRVAESGRIVKEIDPESLGIRTVKENEFLDPAQKIPEAQNETVNLVVTKDGTVSAVPWTWMQPRWEQRKIVYQIWYAWEGTRFVKKIKHSES